jgi:ABC-type nitrate/sulfonate/bicarbonate transport system substrate-binding protein
MAAVSPSPSSRTSAFARLGLGLLVVALAGACSRKSADPQASAAGSSAKENSPGLASYGKPGEPIHLVVGYQPYYSEAWSGVVLNGRALWKKYLPAGSTVEFNIGLQGSILINAMLAGKQQIGYVGDMPAIVGATKREVADIRIVAHIGLSRDQCNVFFTRNDAPTFSDPKAALQWLDGKTVAVPKGSCTDRFARAVFAKQKITPAAYLNQSIELITSGFRVNKLDAAVVWEPTASRLVAEGLARRVATGNDVDEADGAFIDARADLIEQRPDVISGWLRAELDAEIFLAVGSTDRRSRVLAKLGPERWPGPHRFHRRGRCGGSVCLVDGDAAGVSWHRISRFRAFASDSAAGLGARIDHFFGLPKSCRSTSSFSWVLSTRSSSTCSVGRVPSTSGSCRRRVPWAPRAGTSSGASSCQESCRLSRSGWRSASASRGRWS